MLTEYGQLLVDIELWKGRALTAEEELGSVIQAMKRLRWTTYTEVNRIRKGIKATTGMVTSVEERFNTLLQRLEDGSRTEP